MCKQGLVYHRSGRDVAIHYKLDYKDNLFKGRAKSQKTVCFFGKLLGWVLIGVSFSISSGTLALLGMVEALEKSLSINQVTLVNISFAYKLELKE